MKPVLSLIVGLCLVGAVIQPASATVWANNFNNFTGSDGTSVSTYTDQTGTDNRSYYIMTQASDWSGLPAGWLTQGDIESGNKTAKFNNVADGFKGRAKFGTDLPTSMDAVGGVAVAWRMRVGPTNPSRGPIQICLSDDGSTVSSDNTRTTSAFFQVKNNGGTGNTTIDILRNGGSSYSSVTPGNIVPLTLGSNLNNEWHQWTAAVVFDATAKIGYWKLWLDGTQLLFTGTAGSPMYDPDGAGPQASQQFSFYTSVTKDGFGGSATNKPYIGLGDLGSNLDVADFEFDYVNYKDDGVGYFVPEPASLALLAAGACLLARRRR